MIRKALRALENTDSSVRCRAVMAIGTAPDPRYVDGLVNRCAVEPDFFVRDMLTWAITRHPAPVTLPRLLTELRSANPQARSQALHTLSKIGDGAAWPSLTRELLTDPDDGVARAAWRTAVVLVPEDEKPGLAEVLASQLGRGDRAVRLSLSRALTGLGDAAVPALADATASTDPRIAGHAAATRRLLDDPDSALDHAADEAIRIVALGPDGAPE